ncbi:MAG: OmpH family outer membrane protein [Chitinophagaceae bacterium]
MKNINTFLNVVLAIAVAVLFYLQFSPRKEKNKVAMNPNCAKGCVIAYFEMDSIQNHFDYYKQVIEELQKKEKEIRTALDLKKNENISKLKEYQGRGSSMTQDQMAVAQQDLQNRDRQYQLEEQAEASKLSDETRTKLLDVKNKIEDFLKQYNKDKTYSFILSNSSDLIYYKDTSYNITNDIVKGLNELYKVKKK